MSRNIKCPTCSFEFPLENALQDELNVLLENEKKSMRDKMTNFIQQREEDYKKKEENFLKQSQQMLAENEKKLKENFQQEMRQQQEQIRKSFAEDFENKIKLLENTVKESEEKLSESRRKELEYLQKEEILMQKEQELEINVKRQLLEERELMKEQIKKEEMERQALKDHEHNLEMRELKQQLEAQTKYVEEMKRKLEQGSMQLQGEVQELELEDILRSTFIYDTITEVPKGAVGADCVQLVKNQFGAEVGKIIFESKRTKTFSAEWIEKLKTDMRSLNADIAVIVTQAMPKDMERFGEKEGIYICTFTELKSVVQLLRNGLLKVAEARKSQENKGDKMSMLYDYLTGNEFAQQWKAIREGFSAMYMSIQKEREAMEKLWKRREKELEKVLLNASHIRGSIEGIAGSDSVDLQLLDDDNLPLLE